MLLSGILNETGIQSFLCMLTLAEQYWTFSILFPYYDVIAMKSDLLESYQVQCGLFETALYSSSNNGCWWLSSKLRLNRNRPSKYFRFVKIYLDVFNFFIGCYRLCYRQVQVNIFIKTRKTFHFFFFLGSILVGIQILIRYSSFGTLYIYWVIKQLITTFPATCWNFQINILVWKCLKLIVTLISSIIVKNF